MLLSKHQMLVNQYSNEIRQLEAQCRIMDEVKSKNNELEETGSADPDTQLRIFSKDAKENPFAGCVIYGQSGSMVTKLQKRLVELRFLSGIITEKFDDSTLEAVHAYQKAAGLEESEMLSAEELEVLYSDNAVKAADFNVMRYGFAGEDVAQLQSRLASLKYYDGKTSGTYSKAVVSAVESFQKDRSLITLLQVLQISKPLRSFWILTQTKMSFQSL